MNKEDLGAHRTGEGTKGQFGSTSSFSTASPQKPCIYEPKLTEACTFSSIWTEEAENNRMLPSLPGDGYLCPPTKFGGEMPWIWLSTLERWKARVLALFPLCKSCMFCSKPTVVPVFSWLALTRFFWNSVTQITFIFRSRVHIIVFLSGRIGEMKWTGEGTALTFRSYDELHQSLGIPQ